VTEISLKLPKAVLVAECGANHQGDMETAFHMIESAAHCGATYAKFQKRDIEAIPDEIKARPRFDENAFGPTEYEHRKALEFTIEQHAKLKEVCEANGIKYACSAWDERSFQEIADLGVDYIKIPSAKNQEFERWKLPNRFPNLHISLGMLTGEQRDRLLREYGLPNSPFRAFFYACTSKYPCQMEDAYLAEIPYLVGRSGSCGFSGHHRGIALDVAAYILGATWIERHFTLDRSSKGTDHAASLDHTGLSKLVRDLEACRVALRPKPATLPLAEREVFRKMKGDPK
jgi:sialic acid synthase SpsE